MSSFKNAVFVRRLLIADAASAAPMGLLMLAGAGMLERLLGLPVPLLQAAGGMLLVFTAFVLWVAAGLAAGAVRLVAAVNLLWVVASFGVLFAAGPAATSLGVAFIVAQAVFVGLMAVLQWSAVRTPPLATA